MSNNGRLFTTPENGSTSKSVTHQPYIAQASEDPGIKTVVTNRSALSSNHQAVPATHNAHWQQPADGIQTQLSAAYNSLLHQRDAGTAGSAGVRPASSTPLPAIQISIEPSQDHLRQERERLLTYDHDWPANVPVTPKDLAAAGLYRFGVGDMVRCIFCKGSLKQWEPGDNPMAEHRKFFPKCPFVQGFEVGNIKMPVNMEPSQSFPIEYRQDVFAPRNTPSYISYEDFDCRVRSFGSRRLPAKQSAEEMASSGFYYMGPQDTVVCFWCGGSLKNWTPKDRPLSEHIRWFPHCRFAQNLSLPPSATSHAGGSAIVAASQRAQLQPSQPSNVAASIQEHSNSQHSHELPVMLMNMTVDDEDEQRPMESLEVAEHFLGEDSSTSKSGTNRVKHGHSLPAGTVHTSSVLPPSDLLEENRRLRSAVECKICMENDINTLFLPCGHLVCCDACAPSCSLCPICRIEVRGTIRTFM